MAQGDKRSHGDKPNPSTVTCMGTRASKAREQEKNGGHAPFLDNQPSGTGCDPGLLLQKATPSATEGAKDKGLLGRKGSGAGPATLDQSHSGKEFMLLPYGPLPSARVHNSA